MRSERVQCVACNMGSCVVLLKQYSLVPLYKQQNMWLNNLAYISYRCKISFYDMQRCIIVMCNASPDHEFATPTVSVSFVDILWNVPLF